ncbi:MAG: hypothetical protein K8R56_00355, partial [Candidatus Eisenbacteria bacterium]|nr:hypothetical protein [Candidatus Eisenbacteria bacterium]
MVRNPLGPVVALLLAAFILTPSVDSAVVFTPYWLLSGWIYRQNIGDTNQDGRDELLFSSKLDGRLALVDGLTGVILKDFPEFKADETFFMAENIDSNSIKEFILSRVAPQSGPYAPLTRAYKRVPGGINPVFSHTDSIRSVSIVHVRSASQQEFMEISDHDVRLRDMDGTVLFRASTAVSPWTGVDPFVFVADLDGDRIKELGVTQNSTSNNIQTLFFDYSGGLFNYTWSSTSWFMQGEVQIDRDARAEIMAYNTIDGRYAFFDGVSGTPDLELPEFTLFNNSLVFTFDVDNNGVQDIFASRPAAPSVTPLVRAYKWTPGGYVQMFSHTEEPLANVPLHSRRASQFEFMGTTTTDFVLRDAVAGTVLFRASTQIPGWTAGEPTVNPVDLNVPAPKVDDNALNGLWAVSSGDGHFALLDPLTGAVRAEFPAFLASQGGIIPQDFDHDPRLELVMVRNAFNVPQLTTCYRWNGSAFATLFSTGDPRNGFVTGAFRSTGFNDMLEVATQGFEPKDLVVRAFDGSVVFRTSTDIPGWTSVGFTGNLDTMDVNHDGLVEFMATDQNAVRLMHYIGPVGVPVGQG